MRGHRALNAHPGLLSEIPTPPNAERAIARALAHDAGGIARTAQPQSAARITLEARLARWARWAAGQIGTGVRTTSIVCNERSCRSATSELTRSGADHWRRHVSEEASRLDSAFADNQTIHEASSRLSDTLYRVSGAVEAEIERRIDTVNPVAGVDAAARALATTSGRTRRSGGARWWRLDELAGLAAMERATLEHVLGDQEWVVAACANDARITESDERTTLFGEDTHRSEEHERTARAARAAAIAAGANERSEPATFERVRASLAHWRFADTAPPLRALWALCAARAAPGTDIEWAGCIAAERETADSDPSRQALAARAIAHAQGLEAALERAVDDAATQWLAWHYELGPETLARLEQAWRAKARLCPKAKKARWHLECWHRTPLMRTALSSAARVLAATPGAQMRGMVEFTSAFAIEIAPDAPLRIARRVRRQRSTTADADERAAMQIFTSIIGEHADTRPARHKPW